MSQEHGLKPQWLPAVTQEERQFTPPTLLPPSSLTAGMAQRYPGEAASAALCSLLRVHLPDVEMGELTLDTWRVLRMAAAEGLACPAREAQKTFHNEVVHVSPQKPKCPRLIHPILTMTALGRSIQQAATDPRAWLVGLCDTTWADFLWHGRSIEGCSLPGLTPPWATSFPMWIYTCIVPLCIEKSHKNHLKPTQRRDFHPDVVRNRGGLRSFYDSNSSSSTSAPFSSTAQALGVRRVKIWQTGGNPKSISVLH